MKKLIFLLLVISFILICGTVTYAGNEDDDYGLATYGDTYYGIPAGNNAVGSPGTGVTGDTNYINKGNGVEIPDPWKPIDPKCPLGKVIKEYMDPTGQFLVTITRPLKGEIVFRPYDKYIITGESLESGVTVILALYNSESDQYMEYRGIDGKSCWEIGSSGLFEKEFQLKEGRNRFKLISYKQPGDKNKPEGQIAGEEIFVPGENLQISYFTITLLKEDIKNELVTVKTDMTNMADSIFNPGTGSNVK